jgi:type IV secretion system protein VirB2
MKFLTNKREMISMVWCMLAAYAAFLIPVDALAQVSGGVGVSFGGGGGGGSGNFGAGDGAGGAIGDVLCNVVGWFTGKLGQGIATLAIIVIGVGALMGKVSWGMAIIVGIGVGVIFGAPTIVTALGGSGGC